MNALRLPEVAPAPPWSPSAIGRAATMALHDELSLAPKPGLVSFVDSGSHDDMDAATFMSSIFALQDYFVRIAALGGALAPFEDLERCGIDAEARMLSATRGVNTHRGAIFMLGLLCAAAGALCTDGVAPTAAALRDALDRHWGRSLRARCQRPTRLPGAQAARRYGLRSASEEAALGLPILFDTAVPAWIGAGAAGLAGSRRHLQVFFSILAVLDDCNLAHRGGAEGLAFARAQAGRYLSNGGVAGDTALQGAWSIHRGFVQRRLSPGGCADALSSTCLLERLGLLG